MMSEIRGRFLWHELLTTDTAAAASFYSKVIGWKTESWGADRTYTIFTTPDGMMAGLQALPDTAKAMGSPPHWLTYIGTPDVDATVVRAGELGAQTLVPPTDIPEVGRFSILLDPQGAVFAAITPGSDAGNPDREPTVGDWSWHELGTSDPNAAWDFYSTLFGWVKTESMDMGPEMGLYQMYGCGGRTLGGIMKRAPHVPGPPAWTPYTKVRDVHKVKSATAASGGTVVMDPMEVPGGDWILMGMDPQHAMFAVHSAPTAAKKPAASGDGKPKAAAKKKPAAAKKKKPAAKKKAVARRKPAARKKAAPKRKKAVKRAPRRAASKARAKKRPAKKKK
jgi:predicted enzyme related to lactoylglutathione lyase